MPIKLETSDRTFFFASRKQCDTLRFWVYLVGSALEARNYGYILKISDQNGKQKHVFEGEVFNLDKDEPAEGSVTKILSNLLVLLKAN